MQCLYFICERKFYARARVKITRDWKSTHRLFTVTSNAFLIMFFKLNFAVPCTQANKLVTLKNVTTFSPLKGALEGKELKMLNEFIKIVFKLRYCTSSSLKWIFIVTVDNSIILKFQNLRVIVI